MSLEAKKLQQAKELLNYFLLFRANVNDIKYFWTTFTNYNFYVEKFVFKKHKMVLNLWNYSQRSYFCLPTLENSPHVQHFLAAKHKKKYKEKEREKERSSETAHIEIITLFFKLNFFPSRIIIIYFNKKSNLKLILIHAAHYKINIYSYVYRKNEHL